MNGYDYDSYGISPIANRKSAYSHHDTHIKFN